MKSSCICLALSCVAVVGLADDNDKKRGPAIPPVAIFPFQERGGEVKGFGAKVSDLLFAQLATSRDLLLVDREDLKKATDEQEISLSGMVNPAEANQVGHLTGAKILITGSVLQTDQTLYLIAKLIGTETARVVGVSAKGAADAKLDSLVVEFSKEIGETISKKADELLPATVTRKDRLATLKEQFPKGKRPSVLIKIAERHLGQPSIDPAAETELSLWCRELGFDVLDPASAAPNQADVLISGEGFSELASRHGNLVSIKARVEIKAVERASAKVMAIDREVAVNVDLSENIAAKQALQDAAANIAQRMLPKLVSGAKERKQAGTPAK
jgi:TolB-like protein